MFDKIVLISDRGVHIKLTSDKDAINLMNMPIVIEENNRKVIGEVDYVKDDLIEVRFIGEIENNSFHSGIIKKPSLSASIRLMKEEEVTLITGNNNSGTLSFGVSPFYNNKRVYTDINKLFSNHLTILGNSGCGKSYGTSKLIQSIFENPNYNPYKANFILFDNNGEYISAFKNLNSFNSNYNFRVITTNRNTDYEKLTIPLWLLNTDDLALLLQAKNPNQITLIERMLKLVRIFSLSNELGKKYQNHLMAKAMLSILYSNDLPATKKNNIFNIFNTCTTNELNMEVILKGAGYTRKFRDCFHVDANGIFTESILVSNYLSSLLDNSLDNYETSEYNRYSLLDLERALSFALISENWLNNSITYSDAISIKVKLHTLLISENNRFFDYKDFVNTQGFLTNLLIKDNKKYQIVNINLEDVDDMFSKVIVKILSRIIFDYTKRLSKRGSFPFNLVIEEAHRYIKTMEDVDLLGYNIFDRISKEGRKYGVLLTLISQRPVELSETVMSQCANFLIFKTTHPRDIEYITRMVPYITEEIIEKQKGLQAGYCLCFGIAFNVPIIVHVDIPKDVPNSNNIDVFNNWSSN